MERRDEANIPDRNDVVAGNRDNYDAALVVLRNDQEPDDRRAQAYVAILAMDPAVKNMIDNAGAGLNLTYNLCFPVGLRSAMSFYIRMIIYTPSIMGDATIIGFNFLRAAASVDEPEKQTHARSAYMYARGAVAMLAFKNNLFTAGDRPGLIKLIDDLGANVILQLIVICQGDRDQNYAWGKDGADVEFASIGLDVPHRAWIRPAWAVIR